MLPQLTNTVCLRSQLEEVLSCYRRFREGYVQRFGSALGRPDDREVLCDVAAVPRLYAAFKASGNDADVRLPGLESFGPEQLFFLGICFSLCSGRDAPVDGSSVVLEPRCNVPLMHLDQFAKAFNCGSHDPMNSARKCSFW